MIKTITSQEFIERNKTEDLCFKVCSKKFSDNFEDYFFANDDIEKSKKIEVFTKKRYKLTSKFITDAIFKDLKENWNYCKKLEGNLNDYITDDLFNETVEKFNKNFEYYTGDEFICYLDLSKELAEFLKDGNDDR